MSFILPYRSPHGTVTKAPMNRATDETRSGMERGRDDGMHEVRIRVGGRDHGTGTLTVTADGTVVVGGRRALHRGRRVDEAVRHPLDG